MLQPIIRNYSTALQSNVRMYSFIILQYMRYLCYLCVYTKRLKHTYYIIPIYTVALHDHVYTIPNTYAVLHYFHNLIVLK